MIKTKTRFIVNPSAGRLAEKWPYIEDEIQEHFDNAEITFSRYRYHAKELAREALQESCEWIVPVGGDGTINEVVNGIISKEGLVPENVGIIPLPIGTGHDFFRSAYHIRSAHEIFDHLLAGRFKERRIDVGRLTYRGEFNQDITTYVINLSGIGLSSRLLSISNTLRRFTSKNLYSTSFLISVLLMKSHKLEIRFDDEAAFTGTYASILISNGPYGGGGMKLAPAAQIDDGALNCTLIQPFSLGNIIRNYRRLYTGLTNEMSKVDTRSFRKICEIRSICGQKIPIDFDGELAGILPIRIEVVPHALPLITVD